MKPLSLKIAAVPLDTAIRQAPQPSANPIVTAKQTTQLAVRSVDIYDRNAVANYGAHASDAINKYADDVLANVRTSTMDTVGPKLIEIVEIAKELDPQDLLGASKLPIIGGFISKFVKSKDRFVAKFNTLSDQIDKVMHEIDRTSLVLDKGIAMLEDLYASNMVEYNELEVLIKDGDAIIAEENQRLADAKVAMPANPTPIETQQLADWQQAVKRFEKKIADLRSIQMLCVQTMPEIRLIQSGNELLVEKFKTAKTHTIPTWKKQFVLAVELDKQKKGAQLSETVDNATNEFAKRNADLLGQNAVLVAKQAQRAVIDIETLEHCQAALVNTFKELNQIEAAGDASRKAAAIKIENMKVGLHDATIDFVQARIR